MSISYDGLITHGGVIHEALNLEFAGIDDYSAIGIYPEGLNGQLPNADLVTTVVSTAQFEGLRVALHDELRPHTQPGTFDSYFNNLTHILDFMREQTLGIPRTGSALHLKYKIEALTVVGVRDESHHRVSGEQIGRALESALISFNNLLERLHHAYWFYFMPASDQYIPLSIYIAPVILPAVTLIFQSLTLWWDAGDGQIPASSESVTLKGTDFLQRSASISVFTKHTRSLYVPAAILALCHVAGAYAVYMTSAFRTWAGAGPYTGTLMGSGVIVATFTWTTYIMPWVISTLTLSYGSYPPRTSSTWRMLKCLCCMELALLLIVLAMRNPSLSIVLSVIAVPAVAAVRPSRTAKGYWLRTAVVWAASPVGLLGLVWLWEGTGTAEWVVKKVVDCWVVYGSWVLPVVLGVYWPVLLTVGVIVNMSDRH